MKEGHQTWNNIDHADQGRAQPGRGRRLYYKLANVYLSPWFGARTMQTFGFAPQMTGVHEYHQGQHRRTFDPRASETASRTS